MRCLCGIDGGGGRIIATALSIASAPPFKSAYVGGVYFFFQAEDGIRDLTVTGVQTCALPISLGGRTKQVVVAVGVGDSLVRHAELPMVPVADMRIMLKYNSKNYLQQDLPDHVFDCFVIPPRAVAKSEAPKASQKCTVLVGCAKKQLIDDLQMAAKTAGLA